MTEEGDREDIEDVTNQVEWLDEFGEELVELTVIEVDGSRVISSEEFEAIGRSFEANLKEISKKIIEMVDDSETGLNEEINNVSDTQLLTLYMMLMDVMKSGRNIENMPTRGGGNTGISWYMTGFMPATLNLLNKIMIKKKNIKLFEPREEYDKIEREFFQKNPEVKKQTLVKLDKHFNK